MINEIERRIAELPDKSRKLLDILRAKRTVRVKEYPLSYAQQRLWFLDQLEPGNTAYNVVMAVRVRGELDAGALEYALQEVVQRHEVLRTRIEERDGKAVQRVDSRWTSSLEQTDLLGGKGEQEQRIRLLIRQEMGREFDLRQGPLLRAKLARLATDDHVLIVSMHHIVSDGWSAGILVEEVVKLYDAYTSGRAPGLAELEIQYGDYAVWQRNWLEGEVLESQARYWRERLAGMERLHMPVDREAPARRSFAGASEGVRLEAKLAQGLRKLSRRAGVTLFMTLLAGWKIVLARWSGQDDVVVGTDVANRNRKEIEGLIGFFVNQLVLRTDLGGDPTVLELLGRVRETALGAYGHEDIPFEQVVEELNPERSLQQPPLFSVKMIMQNLPVLGGGRVEGIKAEALDMETMSSQLDLLLSVREEGEDVAGRLVYSRDIYEAGTAKRLLRHWNRVLEQMVAGSERRVGELELMDGEERQKLMVEWSRGERESLECKFVQEMFEVQAERMPDSVAVVYENEQVMYGELNRRANQLAHHLLALGVGPEVRVGIGLQRSVETVIAILAVLKAGGAYVPLDLSYPSERLGYVIEDSGMAILLSHSTGHDRLPSTWIPTVDLDREWDVIAECNPANPPTTVTGPNAAYIIYTSGSTGQPKGVIVTHDNLSNYVNWAAHTYRIGFDHRSLVHTSLAFDLTVTSLWIPLLKGARIELITDGPGTEGLIRALENDGSATRTLLKLTPSHARGLVVSSSQRFPPGATVVLGGESLDRALVEDWISQGQNCVFNEYGPTESTVGCCAFPISSENRRDCIPIGKPIWNTQVYVLDKGMKPVPLRVPGELYVGGAGVARGYLNRPDLTAEKFLPNPFDEGGGRLYRTGDRVRWLPEGQLQFLGRVDDQLKLRGYRIEPGEIEAVLLDHPGVRDAVVVTREDNPGKKRLIAYIVTEGETPLVTDVRLALASRLPDYMIPADFVSLQQLPLTANGKLDRKALPPPTPPDSNQEETARSPVEHVLCRVWADVLKRHQVGIHDNFFELGGDSILSLQVIAKARNSGVFATVQQMFQEPTIAGLATLVARSEAPREGSRGEGRVPLTPIQRWFFQQHLQKLSHWNQSVLLRTPSLQSSLVRKIVDQIVEHHDSLRLRFERSEEGEWRQRYEDEQHGTQIFSCVDLRHIQIAEEQQKALEACAEQVQRSLDLCCGPLLRIVLFQMAPGEDRILFVAHHLIIDGVSWRILLEDVQQAYEALESGKRWSPRRTASYLEWAERLAGQVNQDWLRSEAQRWKELDQKCARWSLRKDEADGLNTVGESMAVSVSLDAEQTRWLLQEIPRRRRVQIHEVLIAALGRGIARWNRKSGVLFELEGHGRAEVPGGVDVSRTVGWFTAIYPFFLEFDPGRHPRLTLREVAAQLRRIHYGGVGYGILRYMVGEELKSHNTDAVAFNYLGQFDQIQGNSAWHGAREAVGATRAPEGTRNHELEITAAIHNKQLQIQLMYCRRHYREDTIRDLVSEFLNQVRAIIAWSQQDDQAVHYLLDFPRIRVTEEELDRSLQGRPAQAVYPLSPMQAGMLFHTVDAANIGSGLYVEQLSVKLNGLRAAAFRQAWDCVVERHGVLRTKFLWQQVQEPLQVVEPTVEADWWRQEDWRLIPDQERHTRLQQYLAEDRRKGFDLGKAPVMRVALLQVANESYWMVWSHHHILMDGWSVSRLLGELAQIYSDSCVGTVANYQPARPYADYIRWLHKQDVSAAEQYWRRLLKGFTETTTIKGRDTQERNIRPYDVDSYEEEEILLSRPVTERLQQWARNRQLTLNTVMQGTFGLVLATFAGTKDVVFGATTSGRPAELSGADTMVGLFINTLPVRVRVENADLTEWLHNLQLQQSQGREHEFASLADIQRWSEVERGVPLFDSILVFENFPVNQSVEQVTKAGLGLGHVARFGVTNYALTAVIVPGEQLALRLIFNQSRFCDSVVRRLLAQWSSILEGIGDAHEQRVNTLNVLHESERRQVLQTWNVTRQPFSKLTVTERFERQLTLRPDAVAVCSDEVCITYAELNNRSEELAAVMRQLGVRPEVPVAVYMDRCPEMVVALLGILKAGGAYVPLSTTYPPARTASILSQLKIEVVVSKGIHASEITKIGEAVVHHVIPIDCEPASTVRLLNNSEWRIRDHTTHPGRSSTPENLAYVIFTSGSTGIPKGVMVRHASVSNLIEWVNGTFDVCPNDRVLLFSSLSFDLSVYDIFGTLAAGACIRVLNDDEVGDPQALLRIVSTEQVTFWDSAPAAVEQLVPLFPEGTVAESLRLVFLSGDWIPVSLPDHIRKAFPAAQVVALGGATEATVWSNWYPVSRVGTDWTSIPYGKPIQNAHYYILDRDLTPVPVGVPGHLFIAGECVCSGYAGATGLTAERFVPDPFTGISGARMYATGDMARWMVDGNIEFLGRADQQVKLRGYRIELGEIEGALARHPAVLQTAVIMREDVPGNKNLVAYVILRDEVRASGFSKVCQLPSLTLLLQQNKNETEFLYDKIFVRQVYLKYGIELREDSCVVDVGANIGLFTLFIDGVCPKGQVYAFEPATAAYTDLMQNVKQCAAAVKTFQAAVSSENGQAEFTYYPRYSMMSSFSRYADTNEATAVVKQYLENQAEEGIRDADRLLEHADELLRGRFVGRKEICRVLRLSDFLREERIANVDLLKVDVEGAELDVLQGIDGEDWSRIRQVVVAAQVGRETLNQIIECLEAAGFQVHAKEEQRFRETALVNVYATRSETARCNVHDELFLTKAESAPLRTIHTPSEFADQLREVAARWLPEYMVPSRIVLLDALPVTSNGKLDRKQLPRPDESLSRIDGQAQCAPRDSTEAYLKNVWEDVLGVIDLDVRDNFFALGGNSINSVLIVTRLSTLYGRKLPAAVIFQYPTIERLAAFLRQELSCQPQTTIVPIQTRGRMPPVFFIHAGNGLANVYVELSRQLGPDQPFYSFQSRGFNDNEAMHRGIEDMARDYISDLRKDRHFGPYLLGGWSMGAVVAYEMAQQLMAAGEKVSLLALLDLSAPPNRRTQTAHRLEGVVGGAQDDSNFGAIVSEPPRLTPRQLSRLNSLLTSGKDAGRIPTDVTLTQYQRFRQIFARNFLATRRYEPSPYPGEIALFSTRTEDDVTRGWGRLAPNRVTVYAVPGQHETLVFPPHVSEIAKKLRIAIDHAVHDEDNPASCAAA